MEIKAKEKTGLLMFGFVFAWAAGFFMLSNFFEIFFQAESLGWWVFWVLCAVFVLASSLFLGVGFGAEFVESKAS